MSNFSSEQPEGREYAVARSLYLPGTLWRQRRVANLAEQFGYQDEVVIVSLLHRGVKSCPSMVSRMLGPFSAPVRQGIVLAGSSYIQGPHGCEAIDIEMTANNPLGRVAVFCQAAVETLRGEQLAADLPSFHPARAVFKTIEAEVNPNNPLHKLVVDLPTPSAVLNFLETWPPSTAAIY